MAYYECGGYSKADLDKAYNEGYNTGISKPKTVTISSSAKAYLVVRSNGVAYYSGYIQGGNIISLDIY